MVLGRACAVAMLVAGCADAEPSDRICAPDADPGRVTIHRLNRAEYDNTIRDLLGADLRPAADFPADDFGYGFDNIADVLSLSPLLFEKYELAAQRVLEEALPITGQAVERFQAEAIGSDVGAISGDAWNLWANGQLTQLVNAPIDGTYRLSARAWGHQAGNEAAKMEFIVDGRSLRIFDVANISSGPGVFDQRVPLTAGSHTFVVAFVNDYFQGADDRNLLVDWLEVEGPFDPPPPKHPQIRSGIMICDPNQAGRRECASQIISAFAARAWRRPASEAELERLLQLTDVVLAEGDGFDTQIAISLQAILLSPHFVFRVELDPSPDTRALGDYELASRLSYFLWSSMPDAELFGLAERGELSSPDVLSQQVQRMIADPKAEALIDNFVGQWLATRALDDVNPDSIQFPEWDAELQHAMAAETHAVVKELLTTDRSALDLLSSDFTYVNDRLAVHYGMAPVGTDQLVRVPLDDDRRGGLLQQGSLLTVTSHPRRTSPVKRGKFVLEHLLCTSPPAPPAEVEAFPEVVDPDASLRDRFEQHRADERCQPCHQLMDPIGFALEHYDGIGAWRDDDAGFAIDATGSLIDGTSFDGAAELSRAIQADERFPRCIAQKLMTYGLGRGLEPKDDCFVEESVASFASAGYTLESLLVSLVKSETFRKRRREAP